MKGKSRLKMPFKLKVANGMERKKKEERTEAKRTKEKHEMIFYFPFCNKHMLYLVTICEIHPYSRCNQSLSVIMKQI